MIAQKKKIEPAKIAQLDMNTIGDSTDSVTALQEQLKAAEKQEEMKEQMKKALVEKLKVKKVEQVQAPAPAQNASTAAVQKTTESENTATQAQSNT